MTAPKDDNNEADDARGREEARHETGAKPARDAAAEGTPFSLRRKLMLLAAALAIVPVIATGYALVDVNARTVELLSRDIQLAALDDLARTIDQEMVEAQDGLHAVGRVLTDRQLRPDAAVALALALVEAQEALDHVSVYDGRGDLIDTIREEGLEGIASPERLRSELRTQADEENVATGAPQLLAGEPRVPLVIPLRADGRVTGYAAASVSLRDVQQRVEHLVRGRFEGRPDSLFVVDERLRIVAHPDRARAARLASAAGTGIFSTVEDGVVPSGIARSGEYAAADGQLMLGSMTSLRTRPWAVVAQVPAEIAYASLRQMKLIVVITVALAAVLALLAGLALAGRIAAPIGQLTEFARDLAARRFDRRVKVRTRDELALLGNAMSAAAADLEASEERIREEVSIRADLGRYLPAELVDKVVRREQDMALGGERRPLTVLFADVVAFTPLTEKLKPEEVVSILNEFFTILTGIVFRHGGTVDKFVGDCVMALFGAPTPQADHAARAVAAAEDMLRWLEVGNATWQERFGVTIRLAIGVHTGEVVVGNVGSETRMEYTAIGDVVNVAARLETIARPQQILVTEATREAAGRDFEYVDAGLHTLSGRTDEVQLYEVRE